MLVYHLKECREKTKRTQREIAEHLGIAERSYQRYELSEKGPSLDVLVKLADYFDVSVDYLLGRVDTPNWR